MSPGATRYLEILERSPERPPSDILREVGCSMSTLKYWRRRLSWSPEFKQRERLVRDRYKVSKRLVSQAQAAVEAPLAVVEPPAEEPLEERFVKFLELYEATDDRLGTLRGLHEMGFDLTWEEVEAKLVEHEGFHKRFSALWKLGSLEIEDQLRRKAREGKTWAVPKYLAANFPEKYGARLRVDHKHSGVVRLEAGDQKLVDQERESFVCKWQRRAAAQIAAASAPVSEQIVEGEVLS